MLKTNFREQAENDPRAKGTVGIAISSPSPHLPQRDDQRRSEDVAADGCHATLSVRPAAPRRRRPRPDAGRRRRGLPRTVLATPSPDGFWEDSGSVARARAARGGPRQRQRASPPSATDARAGGGRGGGRGDARGGRRRRGEAEAAREEEEGRSVVGGGNARPAVARATTRRRRSGRPWR